MKRGLLIVPLILASLMIINGINGCSHMQASSECSADNDCIKVSASCCSCEMGGKELCVPKTDALSYAPNCTRAPICAAVFNCNIEKCVCEDKKCKAAEKQ